MLVHLLDQIVELFEICLVVLSLLSKLLQPDSEAKKQVVRNMSAENEYGIIAPLNLLLLSNVEAGHFLHNGTVMVRDEINLGVDVFIVVRQSLREAHKEIILQWLVAL